MERMDGRESTLALHRHLHSQGMLTPNLPEGCHHLGSPTGAVHECGGCSGGLRTIWKCGLHGETLPFYAPGDGFQSCQQCDDYDILDP